MPVMERLLEAGCSRTSRDAHGNQPWHAAAEAAQLDVMHLLKARGCTWNLRNNSGWTALHYAAHAGEVLPGCMRLCHACSCTLFSADSLPSRRSEQQASAVLHRQPAGAR